MQCRAVENRALSQRLLALWVCRCNDGVRLVGQAHRGPVPFDLFSPVSVGEKI